MPYADLRRYDGDRLERMLVSYRAIAETHLEAGHYALARWARGMCTHISLELNRREMSTVTAQSRQLRLVEESLNRVFADD